MPIPKQFALFFAAVLLTPVALSAKLKEHTYNEPQAKIFQAAYKVAREHYTISYVDEKNSLIAFHTGVSAASWGFDANASVEAIDGGKSRLVINVQKTRGQLLAWGAGDRMAKKFFQWVGEELSKEGTDNTSH